ncbi:MAG: patatin-like phospholipase family protein [Promethearchaeota archaeon]
MKRILVLKGGGIRGLLQLDALIQIEEYFHKKIYEVFDLIVGTSIGAITGGILATGKFTAKEYSEVYPDIFHKMFKKKWWRNFFGPIYNRKSFSKLWNEYFDNKPILMRDCKTKFMCTAVNVCDVRTHFFKSWQEKDGGELLENQIAKSFAAPYYFGQYVDPKTRSVFIDGGSGTTNTPIDYAFTEAVILGWDNKMVQIVLIGTGRSDLSIPYEKAKKRSSLKQLYDYIRPGEGGFARIQSTLNKVIRKQIMSNADPLFDFRYYDKKIPNKMDKVARLKYIPEYQKFRRKIGRKVLKDLPNWPTE